MKPYQEENQSNTKFFHPAVIASATSSIDRTVFPTKNMPARGQILSFAVNGIIVNTVQTYPIKNTRIKAIKRLHPSESISIEEFQRKYLPSFKDKDIWEAFKKDLWQEMIEKKISKIKYYRIVSKLTQKELANKLDTKQPNIARIEKVGYKIDISTIKKLGNIFNVDYKEFL